jgi:hypothetical protein
MTYQRKTRDFFDIEGHYAYGWDAVTCEETRAEALAQIKIYRENEPGTTFRIKRYREQIEPETTA